MGAVKTQLKSDLVAAMKARDEVAKSTIRMALAAIQSAEVAGEEARQLTDAEETDVLVKQVSSRRDSAAAYRDGGREELAADEEAEIAVLEKYLPKGLSEDEVKAIIDEEVAGAAGAQKPTMKLMGPVMKAVQARTKGRFDGKQTSQLVRAALS
ncbi:GatB/YqeY domain-containing protein [Acidipropionibacterium jensenii]|uniref:GatB/YqeY domain-containing protein n=1 Tax=Acidipropionibacterium jensenii TaxID=1749 RepID=UPI00110C0424|nr:GatB/YqeY domain-containing protein [Acidipropionibacterium jensenii]QCV89024.1 GatB/YqeY domain-containing protein [Acidipropionibacterium jensenii]